MTMTAERPDQRNVQGSETAAATTGRDPLGPIKYLDLLLLAFALPIFLVADFPIVGWIAGAVLYLLQKAAGHVLENKARAAEQRGDVRTFVGLATGSMIGRGWFVALTMLAVGLAAGKDAGLAGCLLFLAVFTTNILMSMILRPFEKGPES